MLLGDIPAEVMAQIPQVIEAGFPTFKVFTTNIRPNTVDRMARLGHVAAVMEEVAASNGLMVVHAEDDDIVQFLYRRLKDQGTYDWPNMQGAYQHVRGYFLSACHPCCRVDGGGGLLRARQRQGGCPGHPRSAWQGLTNLWRDAPQLRLLYRR